MSTPADVVSDSDVEDSEDAHITDDELSEDSSADEDADDSASDEDKSDSDNNSDSESGSDSDSESSSALEKKIKSPIKRTVVQKESTVTVNDIRSPSEKEVKSVLLANEKAITEVFADAAQVTGKNATFALPKVCRVETKDFKTSNIVTRYELTAVVGYVSELYEENPNILPPKIKEEIATAVSEKKLTNDFSGHISSRHIVLAAVFLKRAPVSVVRVISDDYAEMIPLSELQLPYDITELFRASILS
jgi:hypothetical protein